NFSCLRTGAQPSGQPGADQQLPLMEQHDGQDDGAHGTAGEQYIGDGDAAAQAFVGAAHQQADPVRPAEAQPAPQQPGQPLSQRQQHGIAQQDHQQGADGRG